jgi:hypothetical protein
MLPSDTATRKVPAIEPEYVGADTESLIAIQMDAWARGYATASAATAQLTMGQIERAARNACDEALARCIPFDEGRFCDVFVLAWCGGYCSYLRESGQGPYTTH